MDICLRPMALRPPYFGGNRLGFLLMELRREFILAGVFPHQLPEIGQRLMLFGGHFNKFELKCGCNSGLRITNGKLCGHCPI